MQIPGYVNLSAFSREVNIPVGTVWNHMKQGFCKWPRLIQDGKSSHPLYKTWENMITRCYNPNAQGYENYGGRGISVCLEWRNSFLKFLEDMGEKENTDLTLDRIDVNGNYTKENCRWATRDQQALNTRKEIGCIVKEKTCNSWKVSWRDGKLQKRFKTKIAAMEFLTKLRIELEIEKGSW